MERQRKIIVIGAGLTGLTCAAHLRHKGQDVEVLEATERIGGLMQTEDFDGFIMEQGQVRVLLSILKWLNSSIC